VKFATIELTCSMLEPDADEEACATWDETADMYRGAEPLVDAVEGKLRVSGHEERGVEYRDAYADVSQDRLEELLDLFDEDRIGYDNIDLHDRPRKALLRRLGMRYPRGSGVSVNEKYRNNPREPLAVFAARLRHERDAFAEHVRSEVARTGAFASPMRDESMSLRRTGSYRGWVSITRSTRPGIVWQVTFWEGDPTGPDAVPTGHLDVTGGLEDAAKEVRSLVR
jgi:hypothetical protein